MENNFVYFLHDWDIEMGESYGKYLFMMRQEMLNGGQPSMGIFQFDHCSQDAAAGARMHVTIVI